MRRLLRAASATLIAAGLLTALLLSPQACKQDAPKPSAEKPIIIGVSLGLSKDLGSFTAPLRDAIRTAEGEINAGGGLLGRQLQFDIVDDKSDEGEGVIKVAQDFASRGVTAVIGPVSSGQVKATQKIFADKKIIQLTPSATSVELTDIQPSADRFLFRTTPADDFQGAAVVLFAARSPGGLGDAGAPAATDDGGVVGANASCKKMALVYIDNPYGTSMAKVIKDNFPKTGGEIVDDRVIPLDAKADYNAEVKEIIAKGPGCMALITYEKAAAFIVRDFKADPGWEALKNQGFFFIGTDGVFTQGFLDLSRQDPSNEASPSTAEDVYGTNPDTQPGTTEYNQFKTLYSAYFPLKPTDDAPAFAANTFDAAVLVAFAIQKAGKIDDRVAIREALREVSGPGGRPISPSEIAEGMQELREGRDIDYKGASGKVDLQPNGNVTSGFIIWKAEKDGTGKVAYKTVARFNSDVLLEQIQ